MKVIQWLFTAAVWPTPVMLGVFGLVIPMLLSSAPTYGTTELNLNCTADPNLRIKVGSTLLSVPRRYSPRVRGLDGYSVGNAKKICQLADEPAIDASGVTFDFDGNPHNTEAEDQTTLPIWHVQIQVVRRPEPFIAPERAYNRNVELIRNLGVNLTDLERRHGFLVFDGFPNDRRIYIALPDLVKPHSSVPFTVSCSKPITHTTDSRIRYGRPCRTAYFPIIGSLVGLYKFYDGQTPLSELMDLDNSVRAFVVSLVDSGK